MLKILEAEGLQVKTHLEVVFDSAQRGTAVAILQLEG